MIGADNATLEQRPERFDVVCVDHASDVFALAVMDGSMAYAPVHVAVILLFVRGKKRHPIADHIADEAA